MPTTQTDHLKVPPAERNTTQNKLLRVAGLALGAGCSFVILLQLPSIEPMSPHTRPQQELLLLQGTEERDMGVFSKSLWPGVENALCLAGTGFLRAYIY